MERMHVGTIWIVLAVLALGAWSCDSEDDSGARDGTSSGGTDGANNTDGDGSSTNTLDDSSSSQDTDTGDTSDITSPTTACAATDTDACLDSCFEGLDRTSDRLTEIMTLHSATAEENTWVRIARRVGDRTAVGETFAFDLVWFAIIRDGQMTCVSDPAALAYSFGHHNWDDTLTATTNGFAHAVHIVYSFDSAPNPTWVNTLTLTPTSGGDVIVAELPMTATECESIPAGDLNVCQQTRVPAP